MCPLFRDTVECINQKYANSKGDVITLHDKNCVYRLCCKCFIRTDQKIKFLISQSYVSNYYNAEVKMLEYVNIHYQCCH